MRILFNALSNYSYLAISIVIAVVMTPFLVHSLGDFYYGVWSIIAAITGYFSLMDLGMNRAIVRYVSKYEAENDNDALNVFIVTSLVLFMALGIVIIFITIILVLLFDNFFDLGNSSQISKIVLLIAGIDFSFSFPFGVIYAILIAKQRHTIANKINVVNAIARNVVVYCALSLMPNLIVLVICNVFFNLIKNFFIVFEVKKNAPDIRYDLRFFNAKIIKTIWDYSIYSFAISISSRVINFTDEIIVGSFLKIDEVTYYAIAVNLISYFEKIVWSGASVFVPYMSQLEVVGSHEKFSRSFFLGSRCTWLLTLYIFLGLAFLGKSFVNIWMGVEYGNRVFSVLLILAIAKTIAAGQSMTVARLLGTSKHKFVGIINSFEAILNLGLSVILVQFYGVVGVALGTLIPSIIFNGIVLPIFTICHFQMRLTTLFKEILFGPLCAFLISGYIIHMFNGNVSSFHELIFEGFKLSIIYFSISIVTCFDRRLFVQIKMIVLN